MFPIMQQNKFSNTDTFWYCVVDFLGKETQGLRLKNEFTGGANYIWTRGGLVNVKGPGSDLRQNGVKQEKKPEVIKYLFQFYSKEKGFNIYKLKMMLYHTARRYISKQK